MIRRAESFRAGISILASAAILLAGCQGREPESSIRKKFDTVVASDFKAITSDLPKESLSDSIYFNVVLYKPYKDSIYCDSAVVDYYYIKDVHVKRTVIYRYAKYARKWERSANVYRIFQDSTPAR